MRMNKEHGVGAKDREHLLGRIKKEKTENLGELARK